MLIFHFHVSWLFKTWLFLAWNYTREVFEFERQVEFEAMLSFSTLNRETVQLSTSWCIQHWKTLKREWVKNSEKKCTSLNGTPNINLITKIWWLKKVLVSGISNSSFDFCFQPKNTLLASTEKGESFIEKLRFFPHQASRKHVPQNFSSSETLPLLLIIRPWQKKSPFV